MAKTFGIDGNSTKKRRECIRRLIASESIGTQIDLSRRLEEEGFSATQSTVSRDIRELHLVKMSDKKGKYYALPEPAAELVTDEQFAQMYRNVAVKADRAINLVVIHTAAGMANALCAMMDRMHWKGVIGTLAGDDTILLIAENEILAAEIIEVLTGI